MFLIFRAWLYVRMIEKAMPSNSKEKYPKGREVMSKLVHHKSIFGREYGAKKAAMAAMYAETCGYAAHYKETISKGKDVLEVTAKGAIFATLLGLIDKEVRTFSWLLQLIAIAISIIALVVSLDTNT